MNQPLSALKEVTNWVFDLDDTLYPSSEEIFGQMAERIQAFIMQALKTDAQRAWQIQRDYYQRYGATVRGLMLEYGIPPESFTDYVHELDLSVLKENPELKKCLKALKGKKVVFTNGAYHHAQRVLERLGISGCFDGIFSIREAEYLPKPAVETYEKMLNSFAIDPHKAVMFDDSQSNLKTACGLGMKTVWISTNEYNNPYNKVSGEAEFWDFQTDDLVRFLTDFLMDEPA